MTPEEYKQWLKEKRDTYLNSYKELNSKNVMKRKQDEFFYKYTVFKEACLHYQEVDIYVQTLLLEIENLNDAIKGMFENERERAREVSEGMYQQ